MYTLLCTNCHYDNYVSVLIDTCQWCKQKNCLVLEGKYKRYIILYNKEFFTAHTKKEIGIPCIQLEKPESVNLKIKGFWCPSNRDSNGNHPNIYKIIKCPQT